MFFSTGDQFTRLHITIFTVFNKKITHFIKYISLPPIDLTNGLLTLRQESTMQQHKILKVNKELDQGEPITLQFTEDMHGYFTSGDDNLSSFGINEAKAYQQAYSLGEKSNKALKFHLTIKVEDIHKFINDPKLTATATGYVECPKLGGRLPVLQGIFNLFLKPTDSPNVNAAKEMHYRLLFKDGENNEWTFQGYKVVTMEDPLKVWDETTTLYTRIWKGKHMELDPKEKPWGQGILHLNAKDFAKQMTTLKSSGDNPVTRAKAVYSFLEIFASNLWQAYAPPIFDTETSRWNEHLFPLQTNQGVKNAEISSHTFNTDDGLALSLTRFKRKETQDVVVLLHGLTTSTDMFIMPEHNNLTQYLLDNNFTDVFSLDWRGSNRFTYNLKVHRYSMDDIAMYDIPKAISTVKSMVPENARIHVIAHCVGSIGLMTSVAGGLTKNISSIISNSVSLTPQIRWQSRIKLKFAPWVVDSIFRYPYISPEISYLPGWRWVKVLPLMERAIRRECKEPACHMVSFMWGWGFPAAYEHQNLHPITHRRLKDLFGGTSMNYFRHMEKMVSGNEAVPYKKTGVYDNLPDSYLENVKNIKLPPTLFVSGDKNHIFPNSNQKTYEELKKQDSSLPISFHQFPGYGHQDVFMGKDCDKDIFPKFIEFLNGRKGNK